MNPLFNMAKRQYELNEITAGPMWLQKRFNWNVAIVVEASELMDSLAWKWWKDGDIDLDNAQLECIDIWHFALSMALPSIGLHAAETELKDLYEQYRKKNAYFFKDLAIMKCLDIVHLVTRQERLDHSSGIYLLRLVSDLSMWLGINMDDIPKMYFGKSILNEFRQKNGYKDGTYKKIWKDGKEDNKVMMELAHNIDYNDEFGENLSKMLEDTYSSLSE
jgi:dimeric dUTPase (all-alpha-NTP-PPase superfamily)